DHWPHWFSCLIAGGGFRAGTVIGATSGEIPQDQKKDNLNIMSAGSRIAPVDPITIPELYATILARMGINPRREFVTPIGRPMRYADAEPRVDLLTDAAAAGIDAVLS
ncbi:MAG: DUF1501 domain-containing protein, partial [Planctomycetaceae bacterium]|nr:DUF1501 domain-containing protein [Planctomycetaceae bacterium]